MKIFMLLTIWLAMLFTCPILWGLEQQPRLQVDFKGKIISPVYAVVAKIVRCAVRNAGIERFAVLKYNINPKFLAMAQEPIKRLMRNIIEIGMATINHREAAYLTDRTVYKGLLPG